MGSNLSTQNLAFKDKLWNSVTEHHFMLHDYNTWTGVDFKCDSVHKKGLEVEGLKTILEN